jgi:hypothetical protein
MPADYIAARFRAFRALAFGLLNGFGTALFGTESTAFNALRNRVSASGPSIISGWGFMVSSWHSFHSCSLVARCRMKARTAFHTSRAFSSS